jgi:hypothetical protein
VVQDFIARVKRGKENPANELLHVSELVKLLSLEFMAFAEESQGGERLPGVSPKEAFYNGIDGHPGYGTKPLRQFAANARFLLATHEKEVRVGPQGILFKLAGHQYPFWDTQLEPYRISGERILARFNIEEPNLLACRAADGKTFIVKSRIQMANTESDEQMAQTAKERASWTRGGKVLSDILPHPFRFTIARDSAHSEELLKFGGGYKATIVASKAEDTERARKLSKLQRKADAAGICISSTVRNPDDALEAIERRDYFLQKMRESEQSQA